MQANTKQSSSYITWKLLLSGGIKRVVKELFDHLSLSAILLGAGTISWLCVHVIKKGGNYFLILQGNAVAPRSRSAKGSFSATFPLSQRLSVISRMIELLVST